MAIPVATPRRRVRDHLKNGMPRQVPGVEQRMPHDTSQDALLKLLSEYDGGVLVTLKRDGRPQLSNVNHAYYPDERTVRVSITDDRAKTRNMRRDPRVSYHVTSEDRWAYTVVEGVADLTPVARDPHDETVEELIRLYRDVRGEHPDWDDYRAAMVRDRRLVLRLRIERSYGAPRAR
ncbi:PPOX class F420-dependent oxidoreductase [Streptomyces pseudoechinosporeus]